MFGSRSVSRRAVLFTVAFVIGAALLGVTLAPWIFRPDEDDIPSHWDATVTTVAGSAMAGVLDGDAFRARFSDPFGIAADPDGTLYVADAGEAQRIRRVGPDGGVSTLAGGETGFADGAGAAARFNTPSGIALGGDEWIYVADTGNNAIRRVARDGTVSTVAGDGGAGYVDGAGSTARLNGPIGVAVSADGRVIVADTYNDRIRAIEPDGTVVTLAGDGQPGHQDGAAIEARFHTPCGVATDTDGNIYVADTGNHAIRVISPSGGVTTRWSSPEGGFYRPVGIAVGPGATLYVTDERGRVIEITRDAGARVLAGSRSGFSDGSGAEAQFRAPSGLTLLGPGRLAVTDRRNAAVRLVAARSQLRFREPGPPLAARLGDTALPRVPLLWPFAPFDGPYEITGTFGEARGTESERFHAGLDIHAAEGTTVHAVRSGVVSDPIATAGFDTLSESLRIGPLAYVHLRVGRERGNEAFEDPRFVRTYDAAAQLVDVRVKRGAQFKTGEPIGTVNRFSHVHLNVGPPGEEVNPLHPGLVQFVDTIPPTIRRGGIRLFREDGQPLDERRNRRVIVSGRVRIVVDAWDQVNGNARRRRLGVYRLGYQVLHSDGTPAQGFETRRETIRFDRVVADSDAPRMVYAGGTGIPEFGRRSTRFLYIVTNTLDRGVASPGTWDADALPAGDYILRILVADMHGNEAIANRDVPITTLVDASAR